MYILIVGSPPFEGVSEKRIFSSIKTGVFDKNNKRWNEASFEVKDLISKLLVYDPNKRLTANEAIEHPWFKKTNSNILYYNIPKYEIFQCIQNILSYNINSKFEELVLAYIVHNLPDNKETKTAIKLFKLVNANGNGKMKKDELKNTLLNFVSEQYLSNFDQIFNSLDGKNHGYIEYDEFLRAALDRKKLLTDDNLKYAFHFFDKENNGFMTKDQLKLFFDNPSMDEQLFTRFFEDIDINKDGKIDFQEFKNMMLYD